MYILPFDVTKHLSVAEEPSKIDMEKMTGFPQHNIIVMSVTNTKYVSSHTVTRT